MEPYSHSNTPPRIDWGLYDDESGIIQPHEALEACVPGGLHTVMLGDTFQGGRYCIRDKLGYGGYSTVWLARDLQEEQWVSIKIKKANASTDKLDDDPEIQIMRALEKYYVDGPQDRPRSFVRLLAWFHHEGPNGIHNCLVTELLGPSISGILKVNKGAGGFLAPDTMLRASRQLLEGIEFAHQAGFVHGDVSPINVAFTCNQAFADDEALIRALGGEPVTAKYISKELPRPPNLPQQLVRTADWGMRYDYPSEHIRILDWGAAFSLSDRPTSVSQPLGLRSPETVFVGYFDYGHDLWKAGCVIFTLFYETWPFFHDGFHPFNSHIRTLVDKLGPLPPAWNARWDEMIAGDKKLEDEKNNDGGEQLITNTFEPRRQAIIQQCEEVEMVYQRDEYTDDDYEGLKCLLRVMLGLLRYEPGERISVEEALSYIDWIDHRAEMEEADIEEADTEEAETEEADTEEADTEEAGTEETGTEKADSLGE
ncbi:hypothetical protein V500_07511 [Pseudogymnoascus sp. VKM F-4518 (FW-2643)]|nr:hypothetical protein V500_07511 [Pseudogymnoascus sp. VKM F-4518 (FW-2643)]